MLDARIITNRIRALALGLAAAALAVAALAAPASAGPIDDLPPLSSADIRVTAKGSTTFGNTTRYRFEIKNHGPSNAPTITAYKAARIDGPGNNIQWVDDGYFSLGLAAHESRMVDVSCTAAPPKVCAVALTHAWVPQPLPHDPNKDNNGATIP